jgi:hypothetical protein
MTIVAIAQGSFRQVDETHEAVDLVGNEAEIRAWIEANQSGGWTTWQIEPFRPFSAFYLGRPESEGPFWVGTLYRNIDKEGEEE